MKIRGRLLEQAQNAATEAQKKAALNREQSAAGQSQAPSSGDEQKVELSVARAILALEDSNSAKVERLKKLYEAGELKYTGTQIAEKVAQGIEEGIFFSRLAGEVE